MAAQLADRLPGATLLTVAADGDHLWVWLSRVRHPSDRERQARLPYAPSLRGLA
ncbi:hypothetical protein [Streptomyces sp. NPDC048612]|uniref:hypothetical protein n=1 Tax=Streptomyces sp. NPDC048612 TaxID=3365579 RepID=UPI003718ED29